MYTTERGAKSYPAGLTDVFEGQAIGREFVVALRPDDTIAGPWRCAYRQAMPITCEEVVAFADKWFLTVWGGGSAAAQAEFFLDPNSRIYVVQGGETISFPEHEKLHKQWSDERHLFGGFIKAVVGEDWIIERLPSGELRFVLYINLFHHLLPDSAPLELE